MIDVSGMCEFESQPQTNNVVTTSHSHWRLLNACSDCALDGFADSPWLQDSHGEEVHTTRLYKYDTSNLLAGLLVAAVLRLIGGINIAVNSPVQGRIYMDVLQLANANSVRKNEHHPARDGRQVPTVAAKNLQLVGCHL